MTNATITGTVTSGGSPVPNARVSVYYVPGERRTESSGLSTNGTLEQSVRAASDGTWSVALQYNSERASGSWYHVNVYHSAYDITAIAGGPYDIAAGGIQFTPSTGLSTVTGKLTDAGTAQHALHAATRAYVDAAAPSGSQPLDTDLTQIAALTSSNDDFIQKKSGAWANRTVAQVKTDLGITTTVADVATNTTNIATNTTNIATNTTFIAAGGRLGEPLTATGEYSRARVHFRASAQPQTSGRLQLTYFVATKTEAINTLTTYTSTTAAATLTLARMGVYSVQADGSLVALLAACASDTALWAAGSTAYARALTASWSKVAGTTYALAHIITGTTMPTFYSDTTEGATVVNTVRLEGPLYSAYLDAQTDLVAGPVAVGSLTSSRQNAFFKMS